MSALHLGVSVGRSSTQGGGAALYIDDRPLLAFDEAQLTSTHLRARADQPLQPLLDLPLHKLADSSATHPLVPREAIRACLKGAGVTWSDVSSVSVAGPQGSLERLSLEYSEHIGFQDLLYTHSISAQRALAELALNTYPVEEAVTLVMSSERCAHLGDEREVSAYAIYQSYQAERDVLFERHLDARRGLLLSPVSAYLALIEYAQEALGVRLQASTHPVEWASQLAAYGEPLATLKTWFSLRSDSLDLEVSSYAMWLEILCLARRLEARSHQLKGATTARRLWASLLRKAQEELGEALVTLAGRSLQQAQRTHLLFVGELALDPVLCATLRSAHPSATVHTVHAPHPRSVALGAALYGAQEHTRAVTKGLINPTKEPLKGGWIEELTTSALRAQRSPRDELLHELYSDEAIEQSVSQLSHLLKVTRSEPGERARRFAQTVARGGVVAYLKGPPSLLSATRSARLCLSDPSQPHAPMALNKALKRALDEPTFLICPAKHADIYFEEFSPHTNDWQLASLRRSSSSEMSEHTLRLTPSLRPDQRALVLILDTAQEPELCTLCEALTLHFNRPPVLLATPFNQTSGELIDRPIDALHALINTPQLSLMMGSHWLTSTLSAHPSLPLSLPAHSQTNSQKYGQTNSQDATEHNTLDREHHPLFHRLNDELERLDTAIFQPHEVSLQWNAKRLDELSYHLAPYRPLSHYFKSDLLCEPFFKGFSKKSVSVPPTLSLHPRGLSRLTCPSVRWPTRLYTWPQTLTLIALGKPRAEVESRLLKRLHLPPHEREALIAWGRAELEGLSLLCDASWRVSLPSPSPTLSPSSDLLLGPLQHPQANLYAPLHELWRALKRCGYDEACLAPFREESVARPLSERPSDLLIRLFWRGEALSRRLIQGCLGDEVTRTLIELGVLAGKEELAAQLRLDCIAGAYIASDRPHPLKLTKGERATLPLTPLQRGLVRLALTRRTGSSFDLSHTLGAVSIALARQSRSLYLSVAHERAYRFTTFNLQLNGVKDYHLELSARATLRSPRTYELVFASDPEPLRHAGALLSPQGRLIVMTAQLSLASATPVSVLHRALALTITGEPQPLEDCAQITEHSLQERGGYWVIQQEESLTPHAERPQAFLRALKGPACEALCDYVERYFAQPLSERLMSYPIPSLSIEQHLNVLGEERAFARDLKCESLASIALPPEIYAHLKAELTQRQPSPLSPVNMRLVLAGLKLTTPR